MVDTFKCFFILRHPHHRKLTCARYVFNGSDTVLQGCGITPKGFKLRTTGCLFSDSQLGMAHEGKQQRWIKISWRNSSTETICLHWILDYHLIHSHKWLLRSICLDLHSPYYTFVCKVCFASCVTSIDVLLLPLHHCPPPPQKINNFSWWPSVKIPTSWRRSSWTGQWMWYGIWVAHRMSLKVSLYQPLVCCCALDDRCLCKSFQWLFQPAKQLRTSKVASH